MSLVIEETPDKDLVKVSYYLKKQEHDHIQEMTNYLYKQKALPRATVATYSRAAALKMFKELYHLLAEAKKEQQGDAK